MPKHRIFELAKEFDTTSKVILDILTRNSIEVKNHMSSVDDNVKDIVSKTFARKAMEVEKPKKIEVKQPQKEVEFTNIKKTPEQVVKQDAEPAKTLPDKIIFTPSPVKKNYNDRQFTQRPNNYQDNNIKKDFVDKPRYEQNNNQNVQPNQQRPQQSNNPANAQRPLFQPNQQRPQQSNNPANAQRPLFQPNQQRPQQNNSQANAQRSQQYSNQGNQQRPQQYNNQGNQGNQPRPPFQPNQQRPQQQQQGGRPVVQQRPPYQNNNNQAKTGFAPKKDFPATDNKKVFTPAAKPPEGQQSKFFNPAKKKHKPFDKKFDKEKSDNSNRNKNAGRQNRAGAFIMPTVNKQKPTSIQIPLSISVKDFADIAKREVAEVIKALIQLGVMATINQEIDFDTASLVGNEFKVEVIALPPEQDPTEIPEVEDDIKKHLHRAPVVTIMGHVDHGKTSLLDTIRKTNVTAREAGGITQHIGAYQVNYQGKKIVFLDTPGHEAFTSMRARGAKVTDIAILVVAADDGVMPQTIEAINHAKSAEVPIIVAINKIDKPNAMPDRVKQQLSEHGLLAEDWGGQTIMVPVSAHKKIGLTDLLEMILLVAEIQELTANPTIPAQGTIIEAQLDKGKGPVATVLVQKGTLRIGDTILAGTAYGKVRAMSNERGELLKKAGPSTPVELLGLSGVPMAGDILNVTDEKVARSISEKRLAKHKTEELQNSSKVSLDDIFRQIQDGKLKELKIVVKADVQGTIEALRQSLENIKNDEVKVVVVHSGVGAINETDVMLASASNALIIGFNVRPDANARKTAENEKVDIRMYRVIYDAINDVEAAIKGMLAPKYKEVIQGRVEIRQVITISKVLIAGCYVLEGKITRTSKVRLLRDNIIIYEGELESLRRFKDDVKEVATGYECGLTLDRFRDVKEGDIVEPYIMEEIKQD